MVSKRVITICKRTIGFGGGVLPVWSAPVDH